jgi:ribosome biogenesis GTPase
MQLSALGWDPDWEEQFAAYGAEGLVPARVCRVDRERYRLVAAAGELAGEVSGRFRYMVESGAEFPGVGDWVAARAAPDGDAAIIEVVLPRRGCLRRKAAGNRTEEQVIAANLDVVLVVCGLDGGRNLNLRRLERSLVLVRDSGAEPVILLNKADLCDEIGTAIDHARAGAPDTEILAASAVAGTGLDAVRARLGPGITGALIGPSGVGKSSLINALLGQEILATAATRETDRRGRHTTTRRELFPIPGGGILIDTPGMRELQPWGEDDQSLDDTFADVEALALQCRFADCTHQATPGCAVQQAVAQGTLPPDRLASYLHLKREMAFLHRRTDQQAQRTERNRWKQIAKLQKELKKRRH